MVALRIEEHDKRNEDLYQAIEKSREAVDARSHLFGRTMAGGVLIGLVILFVALFYSMTPILEGVVNRVANSFDWDEKVETAANAELRKRLTAEALAKAIDDKAIQAAAATVVESKEFQNVLQAQVENAVRASVTTTVDEMIAKSQTFQTIINEQLQAEQNRLQAAIKNFVPLTAENRDDLSRKIHDAIADYDNLGQIWTNIDVYPFDDVLHIRARVIWQPEQPENERLRIWALTFEGMTATTPERRQAVETYLGQSVPASVNLMPSKEENGKRFVTGEFRLSQAANHSTYDSVSKAAVENIIGLTEDCFGLKFPATWRVSVSQ